MTLTDVGRPDCKATLETLPDTHREETWEVTAADLEASAFGVGPADP